MSPNLGTEIQEYSIVSNFGQERLQSKSAKINQVNRLSSSSSSSSSPLPLPPAPLPRHRRRFLLFFHSFLLLVLLFVLVCYSSSSSSSPLCLFSQSLFLSIFSVFFKPFLHLNM